MKVRPVAGYAGPEYPTKSILDEHPELLKLVPRRWQTNPVVLSALAALCVMLSGCRNQAGGKDQQVAVSQVAPLFQHGSGTGAFGCVVVNPPVFLSEEEARNVIVEEAKKAAIQFVPPSQPMRKVTAPVTSQYMTAAEMLQYYKENPKEKVDADTLRYLQENAEADKKRILPVTLDGVDAKKGLAFEFISEDDFKAWETENPSRISTVSDFDIITAAKTLRDRMAGANIKGRYAVFYEPSVGIFDLPEAKKTIEQSDKVNWKELDRQAKEMAREELRRQVRDFIAWLKAQGVV